MPRQSLFIKYKLHHIFFWTMVFAFWYFLRYQDYTTKTIALAITLVKVIDLALIIYLVNYFLIPKLLYKKQYALFITAFLLLIAVSGFVKMMIMGQITGQTLQSS